MDTIPNSLLWQLVAQYEVSAADTASWHGEERAAPIRRVISDLRGLLENPCHRWVSVSRAASIEECSEETIRRKCRQGTEEFLFKKAANGQYEIWLPDLNGEANNE